MQQVRLLLPHTKVDFCMHAQNWPMPVCMRWKSAAVIRRLVWLLSCSAAGGHAHAAAHQLRHWRASGRPCAAGDAPAGGASCAALCRGRPTVSKGHAEQATHFQAHVHLTALCLLAVHLLKCSRYHTVQYLHVQDSQDVCCFPLLTLAQEAAELQVRD